MKQPLFSCMRNHVANLLPQEASRFKKQCVRAFGSAASLKLFFSYCSLHLKSFKISFLFVGAGNFVQFKLVFKFYSPSLSQFQSLHISSFQSNSNLFYLRLHFTTNFCYGFLGVQLNYTIRHMKTSSPPRHHSQVSHIAPWCCRKVWLLRSAPIPSL